MTTLTEEDYEQPPDGKRQAENHYRYRLLDFVEPVKAMEKMEEGE